MNIRKEREREWGKGCGLPIWRHSSCGTWLEIRKPGSGSDSAMYCVCDFSQVSFPSLGLFHYPFKLRVWIIWMLRPLPSSSRFLGFYVLRKALILILLSLYLGLLCFPLLCQGSASGWYIPPVILASSLGQYHCSAWQRQSLTMTRAATFLPEAAGSRASSLLHILWQRVKLGSHACISHSHIPTPCTWSINLASCGHSCHRTSGQ